MRYYLIYLRRNLQELNQGKYELDFLHVKLGEKTAALAKVSFKELKTVLNYAQGSWGSLYLCKWCLQQGSIANSIRCRKSFYCRVLNIKREELNWCFWDAQVLYLQLFTIIVSILLLRSSMSLSSDIVFRFQQCGLNCSKGIRNKGDESTRYTFLWPKIASITHHL